MRLLVDTHTHTTMSGHAFSTLIENLDSAAAKGLSAICVTDHASALPGAQPDFIVGAHDLFPHEYKGVRIIGGSELNIMDYDGNVDMEKRFYVRPSFLIASLHDVTIDTGGTVAQNTSAMIGALSNPYIDVIGHPGNCVFPVDRESVVLAAKRFNKLIEINNHSFIARKGSVENCRDFVRLCKKHDVRICVGSDAHLCLKIGIFDHVIDLLMSEEFPIELIVSRDMTSFDAYLEERTRRIDGSDAKIL